MTAHSFHTFLRRRSLVLMTIVLLSSITFAYGIASGVAQESKEEREVEDKIPKHLPIKVKIKKPEKLKDLKKEEWLDNVEIEVTNTGKKPIYFLSIHLALPDVLAENGNHYVFLYHYGRISLTDFGEPVQPGDIPIQPGESVTINPPANHIEGWKRRRAEGEITNPKKLEFKFQEINHGDGTGFLGSDGTPIPIRKE